MAKMNRIQVCILLGRLSQILLAIALAGFSLAVDDTVYNSPNKGMLTAGVFGVCIAVFGVVGFFDLRSSEKGRSNTEMFWVVFALDCLAVAFGTAASTTVVLCAHWLWWVDKVTFVVPIVCGYLSSIVLLPFVVRSIREWRKQPQRQGQDFSYPPEKQLCARCHSDIHSVQAYYPIEAANSGFPMQDDQKAPNPRVRSFDTGARWSGTSEAATLAYPTIAAVASQPNRVPSHTAPSYTSRISVKSKP